jgi:hypothetical protein
MTDAWGAAPPSLVAAGFMCCAAALVPAGVRLPLAVTSFAYVRHGFVWGATPPECAPGLFACCASTFARSATGLAWGVAAPLDERRHFDWRWILSNQ